MRIVLGGVMIVATVACGRAGDEAHLPSDAGGSDASDAGACVVNGRVYRDGEHMPPRDCNPCLCKGGRPVCNTVGCPIKCRARTDVGEATYDPGDPMPSTHACESCICGGGGPTDIVCEPIVDCISDAGAD